MIVLLEDNDLDREAMALMLASAGYSVRAAATAVEAITFCKHDKPRLLITDICMRVMDGIEVIKALRADSETAEIPVLVVTGDWRAETEAKAANLGVIETLLKPVESAKLLEAVQRIVEGKSIVP